MNQFPKSHRKRRDSDWVYPPKKPRKPSVLVMTGILEDGILESHSLEGGGLMVIPDYRNEPSGHENIPDSGFEYI